MNKKLLLAIAALLGPWLPPAAMAAGSTSYFPHSYVSTARLTVAGSSVSLFAFQNTSSGVDVVIRKIEISNASTATVTGGTMQFWVYASTQITHSAAITTNYEYAAALIAQPSYISVSSAPTGVLYEGDSSTVTSAASALAGVPPIIRPLYVNNDETATTLLTDSWGADEALNAAGPLVLNAGANRGIVINQKRLGTSDFTAGSVLIRIFYTTR